jgi:excinuclease UvrABC ATPase subunit
MESDSLTAKYLTGREQIKRPERRRPVRDRIILKGAARKQFEGHRCGFPAEHADRGDRRKRQRQNHLG